MKEQSLCDLLSLISPTHHSPASDHSSSSDSSIPSSITISWHHNIMPGNNSNLLDILNWHTMSGSAKVRDSQTACISATITVAHSLYLTWCQKFRSLFNHIVKLIHGLLVILAILLDVGNINEIWDLFDTTGAWLGDSSTRAANERLSSSRDILVDDSIRTRASLFQPTSAIKW